MDDMSEYLKLGLKAVKAAEAVILQYLDKGVTTELKEDQSPVTIADKEAEDTIRQVISAHFPDHTFFGEEGDKTDLRNHHGYSWIIDPIDGTKSYIHHIPIFATLLALMHDGELIVGISNIPLMHELMYAEKGRGAYLNDAAVHVSATDTVADAYLSHGSLKYFVQHDKTAALLDLATEARQARGFGDAWSYHLLAQGKIDIVLEPYCKLWDIAAAKVIVEEAGGKLTQLDGQSVGPATISALATNGQLHNLLVRTFNQ